MKKFILWILIVFTFPCNGQELDIEQLTEKIMSRFDENIDYERLTELIHELIQEPVNLTTANENTLGAIWFLSPAQIQEIIDYRHATGFLSLYELQNLSTLDLETIELLIPFLEIRPPAIILDPSEFRKLHTHNLLIRYDQLLQDKAGFNKEDSLQRFKGSPGRFIIRYRIRKNGKLSAGINLEKDEGEELISGYGFDHSNFHLMLEGSSIKRLIIGDYRMEFGQALVLGGAGFNSGKGIDPIVGIKRNDVGIRPHHSITEYGYFRGIATSIQIGKITTSIFGSWRNLDAGIQPNDPIPFLSIRASGLHRTPSEKQGQGILSEQVYGLNSDLQIKRNLKIGINGVFTRYSLPLNPRPRDYNQFYFRGKSNITFGFHFDYLWENLNLFGEIASDEHNLSPAWNLGILANLSKKMELSLHLREYPAKFHSFHGSAFSEKSNQRNEKGIYLGLKYKINRKHKINLFADQFIFPWLNATVSRPDYGFETGFQWDWRYSKRLRAVWRYSLKETAINQQTDLHLPKTGRRRVQHVRLFLQNDAAEGLSLRTRIQFSFQGKNMGMLAAQDLQFDLFKKIKLNARLSLFDTHNHHTRQYVYENDVLYGFSILSFAGVGIRSYLMVRYKLFRKLTLWLRYSNTRYRDRDEIGQGVERIQGNQKSEIRVQMKYDLR